MKKVKVEPKDWADEWSEKREEAGLEGEYKEFAKLTEAIIDAEQKQRAIDQRKANTSKTCSLTQLTSQIMHPGVDIEPPKKGEEIVYNEKLQAHFSRSLNQPIKKDTKKNKPDPNDHLAKAKRLQQIQKEKKQINDFLKAQIKLYEHLLDGALSEEKLDIINFQIQDVGAAKIQNSLKDIISKHKKNLVAEIPELQQLKEDLSKKTDQTNKMLGVLDKVENQTDIHRLLSAADLVEKQLENIEPEKLLFSSSEKRAVQQDIGRLMILTVAKRLSDAKENLEKEDDKYDFFSAAIKNNKLEEQLVGLKEKYTGPAENFKHVSPKDVQEAEEKVRQRSYKLLDISDHEKHVDDIVKSTISTKKSYQKAKKNLVDNTTRIVKNSCLASIQLATESLEEMKKLRSKYEGENQPEILKDANKKALSICKNIENKISESIEYLNQIYSNISEDTNDFLTSLEKSLILENKEIKQQVNKQKKAVHTQTLKLTAAYRNLAEHHNTLSAKIFHILTDRFEPGTILTSKSALQCFYDESNKLIYHVIKDKKPRGKRLDSELKKLEQLKDGLEDNQSQFIDDPSSKNEYVIKLQKIYNQVVAKNIGKFINKKYNEKDLDQSNKLFLTWKDEIEKNGSITSEKDARLLKDIIMFLQKQGVEPGKDIEHYRSIYYILNFLAQSNLLDDREAIIVKTKLAVLDVLKENNVTPYWLPKLINQTDLTDMDRLMMLINKDTSLGEKFEKDIHGHWKVYVEPVKEKREDVVLEEVIAKANKNEEARTQVIHNLCSKNAKYYDEKKRSMAQQDFENLKSAELNTLSFMIKDHPELLYAEDEHYHLPIHTAAVSDNLDAMTIILNSFEKDEDVLEHLKINAQIISKEKQKEREAKGEKSPPYNTLFLATQNDSRQVLEFLVEIFNRESVNSYEFLELFDHPSLFSNDFLKPRVDFVRLFNQVTNTGNQADRTDFLNLMRMLYEKYDDKNHNQSLSEDIKKHIESVPRKKWGVKLFGHQPPCSNEYIKNLEKLAENNNFELPNAIEFIKNFMEKHILFSPERLQEKQKKPGINSARNPG